ncbi:hypothetical protein ACPPVO_43570 [Dactylosporangium sp. McL0621]|uniref:hypothetical protein n=1 Tax=Dactylosporangium sp. McL0621 TaxID=3415678 RepID=UPI003CF4410D
MIRRRRARTTSAAPATTAAMPPPTSGHPFDVIVTKVDVDENGNPTPEAVQHLAERISRDVQQKFKRIVRIAAPRDRPSVVGPRYDRAHDPRNRRRRLRLARRRPADHA